MQFSAEKDSLARRGQLAAQHGGDDEGLTAAASAMFGSAEATG